MTSPVDILGIALAASGIALIVYGPWQKACTDLVRQPLFDQRDRLFVLAESGRISFDDPAYRETRALVNGLIRYAHLISITRLVFHHMSGSLSSPKAKRPAVLYIDRLLDSELKDEMSAIVAACDRQMLELMFLKSPVLLCAMLMSVPILLILRGVGISGGALRDFFKPLIQTIHEEAVISDEADHFVIV